MRSLHLLLPTLALLTSTTTANARDEVDGGTRVQASGGSQRPGNEALRKTLERMWHEDQDEAQRAYSDANVVSHHVERQKLLEAIVAEYGWPGVGLVGKVGAAGAWIVAQHADDDVAFQRRCLTLVEVAFQKGDVPALHLAYLTDRVLVNEKKPQIYGTQGAAYFSSEAEKAKVNERRRKLGLPSMAEMAREKGRFYEQAYKKAARARN